MGPRESFASSEPAGGGSACQDRVEPVPAKEASATGDRTGTKKRRGGGGGAFRAFCHMQAAGQKMTADNMRKLGEAYRGLSDAERSYYHTIGHAATSCHREGRGAFAALSARAKRNHTGHATELDTPPCRRQTCWCRTSQPFQRKKLGRPLCGTVCSVHCCPPLQRPSVTSLPKWPPV